MTENIESKLDETFAIKFWGVRGSIPTPSTRAFKTDEYGGNTSCVEVTVGAEDKYILDAGSGLRVLGNALMQTEFGKGKGKAKILLSHVHWDHIQGWPFFVPAYIPGNQFEVYGGKKTDKDKLEEALQGQPEQAIASEIEKAVTENAFKLQQSKYVFPVRLEQMASSIKFYDLSEGCQIENGVKVSYTPLNHPDGVLSYKFEKDGKTFVYATDNEHDGEALGEPFGTGDERLMKWMRNAELVVYDGQYTPEEYNPARFEMKQPSKIGWGHSTYEKGIDMALIAGVKKLMLFHHDPSHNDEKLSEIEARAKKYLENKICANGLPENELEVSLAYEGMEIKL